MKSKVMYLEVIRVLAILGVIFNHTNQHGFFYFPNTNNPIWYVISLLCSVLCKVSVPLFFMISGYLLLQKEETLKVIFVKRILRYAFIIGVMSAVTYMIQSFYAGREVFNPREIIKTIYRGDIGTYWFLYAYMGILLMLPFLRGCTRVLNKENVFYLIILRLIVIGILPIAIFVCLGYPMETSISSPILGQSVFYFLIGYYFGTTENIFDKQRVRVWGMLVSTFFVVISAVMTYYEYKMSGTYTERFLEGLLPIVCITIWGLVRYYSRNLSCDGKIAKGFVFFGDKTFGIYLLEPSLRIILYGLYEQLLEAFPDFVASIIWTVLFFIIATLVVWIIKLIPFVKKMI